MTATAPAPADLDQLDQLDEWLTDPANRTAWRKALTGRQAEYLVSRAAVIYAARPSQGIAPQRQAEIRQESADAEARLELARLVEEFAENTRFLLTIVLAYPRRGVDAEDDIARATHAETINRAVRAIMCTLTDAQHLDPGEAHRNAHAVLFRLLDRRRSADSRLTTTDLNWWAGELVWARRVVDLAPTVG